MLLWPEASHTSPISTLRIIRFWVSFSVSMMFWGVNEPFGVCTVRAQLPSLSARVEYGASLQDTRALTNASGSAVPQSFTSVCCCSTIPSENSELGLSVACAYMIEAKNKKINKYRIYE